MRFIQDQTKSSSAVTDDFIEDYISTNENCVDKFGDIYPSRIVISCMIFVKLKTLIIFIDKIYKS